MLSIVKLAITGTTSGLAGRWEGEAKFAELDRIIPVYIAHFERMRAQLSLPSGHPLLSTAARMISEAKEACGDYRKRIETNRNSRVAEAVDTAKELAGGVVGIKYWETRFGELLTRLQSLVVASLTLTAESAAAQEGEAEEGGPHAALLQYLSHCFSLVRLGCEVPAPPTPADGDFPGFVLASADAPYSGRLDVQWDRPPGPPVRFDGGESAEGAVDLTLYRSRPRRYQLWCERSFDVVQGSLNQLHQLGVDDFLEPSVIGLGRHVRRLLLFLFLVFPCLPRCLSSRLCSQVMDVESEEEIVRVSVLGGSDGLAAGTKYAMAVRAWLNPPAGCATAWSKWSNWSHIGNTSASHLVIRELRCLGASEHGLTIGWACPAPAETAADGDEGGEGEGREGGGGAGECEYEYEIRLERTRATVQAGGAAMAALQEKVEATASTLGHLAQQMVRPPAPHLCSHLGDF